MSKSPGQSAMEYMLTYGWAILVVMVVGIVMWQIGIFNIGGSVPTTSDGFAQLKPMLAACKMSEDDWNAPEGSNGFQCMFTNTLLAGIAITDMNFTVDGKYCARMNMDILPEYDDDNVGVDSSFLMRTCTDADVGNCGIPLCVEQGGGACGCSNSCLNIPAESTFFVNIFSLSGSPIGPCWDINQGTGTRPS